MTPPKRRTFGKGLIIWLLFGSLFALGGLWCGQAVVSAVVDYFRMQSWEEVPATMVRANLKCTYSGSDGNRYEKEVEYRYRYQDQSYTGKRVSLNDAGSTEEDEIAKLDKYCESGKTVPCYVNPHQPDEAILYRDLPWHTLLIMTSFTLVFGGFGFGLLIFLWVFVRKNRKKEIFGQAHPKEPWLWKKAWAEGRIRSSSLGLVFPVIFAGFWTAFCVPLVWFVLLGNAPHHDAERMVWWIVAGLTVVNFLLILWVVTAVARRLKYGRSVFEMASVPGVIGGQLVGVVRCSRKIRTEDLFQVTLRYAAAFRGISSGRRSKGSPMICFRLIPIKQRFPSCSRFPTGVFPRIRKILAVPFPGNLK